MGILSSECVVFILRAVGLPHYCYVVFIRVNIIQNLF